MNFVFQFHLHRESTISEMTRFHHDNQNENRLNYFDFFRRLIEFQNEMNHHRMTLFVDLNEKESINQAETF